MAAATAASATLSAPCVSLNLSMNGADDGPRGRYLLLGRKHVLLAISVTTSLRPVTSASAPGFHTDGSEPLSASIAANRSFALYAWSSIVTAASISCASAGGPAAAAGSADAALCKPRSAA